jgi:uncharacterized damage-inducible protein DinB
MLRRDARHYATAKNILYGAPPETLAILLDDPEEHDFASLESLLADLSPMQATERPAGLPHSIAEIVAHLLANALFNLGLIESDAPETFQPPLPNWTEVSTEEWEALRKAYIHIIRRLQEIARKGEGLEKTIFPATASEPAWTAGYKLTCSVAKHAAYHAGQIALLRRALGADKD